jgi:hypothetical protein
MILFFKRTKARLIWKWLTAIGRKNMFRVFVLKLSVASIPFVYELHKCWTSYIIRWPYVSKMETGVQEKIMYNRLFEDFHCHDLVYRYSSSRYYFISFYSADCDAYAYHLALLMLSSPDSSWMQLILFSSFIVLLPIILHTQPTCLVVAFICYVFISWNKRRT